MIPTLRAISFFGPLTFYLFLVSTVGIADENIVSLVEGVTKGPDGHFYLLKRVDRPWPNRLIISRYLPDGSLDSSFGREIRGHLVVNVKGADDKNRITGAHLAIHPKTGDLAVGVLTESDPELPPALFEDPRQLESGLKNAFRRNALLSEGRVTILKMNAQGDPDLKFGKGGIKRFRLGTNGGHELSAIDVSAKGEIGIAVKESALSGRPEGRLKDYETKIKVLSPSGENSPMMKGKSALRLASTPQSSEVHIDSLHVGDQSVTATGVFESQIPGVNRSLKSPVRLKQNRAGLMMEENIVPRKPGALNTIGVYIDPTQGDAPDFYVVNDRPNGEVQVRKSGAPTSAPQITVTENKNDTLPKYGDRLGAVGVGQDGSFLTVLKGDQNRPYRIVEIRPNAEPHEIPLTGTRTHYAPDAAYCIDVIASFRRKAG